MGKKEAQRTKGNTKAASSARSAQLLGDNVVGFVGFGTTAEAGFVPLLQSSNDADTAVPADFRLALRKMHKKDVTTRLKALQEFNELCTAASESDMTAVLPFWPAVFNKLGTDGDRRVRELAHTAMGLVAKAVGKSLTPHLKAVSGVWFLGQADNQAPAAQTAAVAAWQAAFPTDEKQSRALNFCQTEILALIVENLTTATAQTLSDPKTSTPEEMEAKFIRTLATSLLAYTALLDSPDALQKSDIHAPLLDSPKFWKMARHNATAVRQAFYTAVSKLCIKMPEAMVARSALVAPTVLGGFVLELAGPATAWGAALYLLDICPVAWDHISHQKAVFPLLWKLLKSGGQGDGHAAQIYPNLMPLLSKIPPAVMGDRPKFLQRWFASMLEGLQTEKVQKNPSECRAVVQSMVECLFYCLSKQEDVEAELKDSLVRDYLLELVRFALCEGREKNCRLLSVLPDFLLYWDKNCCKSPQVAHLNSLFWSGLKYFCSTCEEGNRVILATAMVELAQALRAKRNDDEKNAAFVDESMDILALMAGQAIATIDEAASSDANIQGAVTILEIILSNFGGHDVILAKIAGGGSAASTSSNENGAGISVRQHLYRAKIVPLLQQPQWANNEAALARLTWALAKEADTAVAVAIVEEFVSATQPQVVNYIVPLAKKDKEGGSAFLSMWLSRPAILSLLTEIAEGLALSMEETKNSKGSSSEQHSQWTILRTILGCGVAMPEPAVKQLVAVFLGGIRSVTKVGTKAPAVTAAGSATKIVEFVCELFTVLLASGQVDMGPGTTGLELVRLIFSLDSSSASTTRQSVESAWVIAVERGGGLELWQQLAQDLAAALTVDQELTLSSLDRIVDKGRQLIRIARKQEGQAEVSAESVELMSLMIPQDGNKQLSEQHLYRRIFSQKLFLSNLPESIDSSLLLQSGLEAHHLTSPHIALFFVSLLAELLSLQLSSSSSDDDFSEEEVSLPAAVTDNQQMMSSLADVAASVVYLQSLALNRSTTLDMVSLETRLTHAAAQLLCRLARADLERLLAGVYLRSRQDGMGWPAALSWLLGLAYKHAEWDLQLSDYLPPAPDGADWTDGDLNTTAAVLELMFQLNVGHAAISATLGLELGRLLSLGGLTDVDAAFPRVWLITQCIRLTKANAVGWHVAKSLECREEVSALLDLIPLWRVDREEHLLYNADLSEASWDEVNRVATIAHLLTVVVAKCPELIKPEIWDFVTCSLVSWTGSLEESKESLGSRGPLLLFTLQVAALLNQVGTILGSATAPPGPGAPEQALATRQREEWAEFFAEGIYSTLLPLFLWISSGKDHLYSANLLSVGLGEALLHCPVQLILSAELPPLFLVQDVDAPSLPDNIVFILNHFGPLLGSACRSTQVTAAHILSSIMPQVAKSQENSGEEEELEIPRRLTDILLKGEMLLENILIDFEVCESVGDIPPGTLAFSQTLGYLLAWRVILTLIQQASDELRPKYSEFIENKGHMKRLLSNVFRLLPSTSSPHFEERFRDISLEVAAEPRSEEIQNLAASCWTGVCRHLPALARLWWSRLAKPQQAAVEKVTSSMVTPLLWQHEVKVISAAATSDNLTLKVRETVREVVATYSIDEGSMELLVSLPANYPLGGLTVESGKRVGVETGQWRKWMLQLTTFLTHQNGTIHEGLNLWKRNVDKRFQGVEECYICFYILHGSNHQLPKLGCRTCKKKFHSACLYKWFSTSNNSSCPLCRNLF